MVDKVDKLGPKWWRDERGINVLTQFSPEIHIDIDFNLTTDEYDNYIMMIQDRRASRVQRAVSLYFAEKKTLREIAKIVGVSKSQVHKDLRGYRKKFLSSIKLDLDLHQRAFGLLVELTEQVDNRIRILWSKYQELEECSRVLDTGIRRAYSRLEQNPRARMRNIDALREEAREKRIIIDSQRNILSQLRIETQQALNIYNMFGLCSKEAADLANKGESYIQKQIEDVTRVMRLTIAVVKDEVEDIDRRKRIFSRVAQAYKRLAILDKQKQYDHDEDNEFRI